MTTNENAHRYTVTAALPYANGYKHIGHLAGAYLPADIFVRFLRSKKEEVLFVCGSDENGAAITLQALKEGKTPQEIVDFYHPILEKNLRTMGVSFDIYHRTSSPLHHQTSKEFFDDLLERNLLEKKEEEQFFDEQAQLFLADRYIQGTCPHCGYDGAYGDQCEKCGNALSPQELIAPRSIINQSTPILKKTTHYYLPLSNYEPFIKRWMEENQQKGWKLNVVGQCKSWLNEGLKSRAVTRDLNWGVKVQVDDVEKVLYVWFEAPIGYISATKQWALQTGNDWEIYWKDPNTKLIHFIGKDNIVFHCIIFPAMLRMRNYILPEQVPANEFVNLEGDKMSTSRNWKLDINEYIDELATQKDGSINPKRIDALRFYLTQIMPETKDSEFLWKKYQEANNSELVSIWGNFLYRTWVLTHKLCKGRVPPVNESLFTSLDQEFITFLREQPQLVEDALRQYKFREGLSLAIDVARKSNKYLQEKEPWIVQKSLDAQPEKQKEIDNTLFLCLQAAANMAILIYPFLPNAAQRMCKQMKVVEKMLAWENVGKIDLLRTGYPLPTPELLFDPIEDELIEQQIEKLKRAKQKKADGEVASSSASETPKNAVSLAPEKPSIEFDTFEKMDLRVATIVGAEKVPQTDKLCQFLVDVGFEKRTVISGVAHQFSPEELIGQRVILVANLKPRKIKGIESKGMLLLSQSEDGKLRFILPDPSATNGEVCS